MSQKSVFLNGEADNWFKRNEGQVNINEERDQITFLNEFIQEGFKVLEVGCSFGCNIKTLTKKESIEYVGIDPSGKAIAAASNSFPNFYFKVGTADQLDFPDESFDVVYFGFCLYLVDRADLIKIVYETNRVLRPGGYIFITDFSPSRSYHNTYTHAPGVYSFKMNYENLFLSFPTYSLINKRLHLKGKDKIPQEDDRVATVVLQKSN